MASMSASIPLEPCDCNTILFLIGVVGVSCALVLVVLVGEASLEGVLVFMLMVTSCLCVPFMIAQSADDRRARSLATVLSWYPIMTSQVLS